MRLRTPAEAALGLSAHAWRRRWPSPGPSRRFWSPRARKQGDGGAEGGRTPDLVNAIHALSQLSYSPTESAEATAGAEPCQSAALLGSRASSRPLRTIFSVGSAWYDRRPFSQSRGRASGPSRSPASRERLIHPPEWRNWYTQGTQNPPAVKVVWVRIPPPAPANQRRRGGRISPLRSRPRENAVAFEIEADRPERDSRKESRRP